MKMDISENLTSKDVINLITEKGSHIVLEKTRELIESKIKRMSDEIANMRDMALRTESQLNHIRGTLREIAPHAEESARLVSEHRKEREFLLKEIESRKDADDKRKLIEKRKEFIEKLSGKVSTLSDKHRGIHSLYEKALNEKESLTERLTQKDGSLNQLKSDIKVLKEKKQLLTSKLPTYENMDELKVKQVNAEKEVEKLKAEVKESKIKIDDFDKEISQLKDQSASVKSEMDSLSTKKNQLLEKVSELEAVEDREALAGEVETFRKRKNNIKQNIEESNLEQKKLASSIIETEKGIEEEKQFESSATARMDELKEQKEDIDNAASIFKRVNLDLEVNSKFQEMVLPLKSYLEPLNSSLNDLGKEYKRVLSDLGRIIDNDAR